MAEKCPNLARMHSSGTRTLTRRPALRPDRERGRPSQDCKVLTFSRYRLHVSTQPEQLETWAELAARTRGNLRLKKAAFARALDVHVDTVTRWEEGKTRPTTAAAVQAFAATTGIDLNYALRVARLVPEGVIAAGTAPEREEPAIEVIRKSSLPEYKKQELIDDIRAQTDDAREQRRVWAEKIIKLLGRPGLNGE
jgi:DNA-binding transcriptional regulator YiaG